MQGLPLDWLSLGKMGIRLPPLYKCFGPFLARIPECIGLCLIGGEDEFRAFKFIDPPISFFCAFFKEVRNWLGETQRTSLQDTVIPVLRNRDGTAEQGQLTVEKK